MIDALLSLFKEAPPPPPDPTAYERLAALRPLYVQEGCAASAYPFLAATLIFTLIVSAWERYLDWRQHVRVAERGDKVPEELETLVAQIGDGGGDKESSPAALLEKLREKAPATRAYALDKSRFKFISSAYALARGLAFVYGGALPYMWDAADAYGARWFGGSTFDREIKTSLIFYGVWEIADTLLNLPVSLYSTFVVEQRHGFNKSTLSLYVVDLVKTLLLTAFLGAPVLALFLKVVLAVSPQNLALYMGGFFLTVSFLFITIYPVVIQPMFNKYEPLEPGPLRSAIEALAASVDYPLYKLFTVDGSKRSGHSNAYMFGFFKSKRIVLFDTLLKQATTEEIVAILAHELGHWAHGHVLLTFCVTQTYLFVAFAFFAQCMGSADLYAAFGFRAAAGASDTAGAPALVGVLLFFNFLWEPVDHMLSFAMTWNSRRMEYQADRYGADRGHGAGLQRGLVKITFENLGVLDPDPWFSTYHHSHPTLMERLRGIDAAAKKTR
mmetsp:Transcript_6499/g.20474  ORF Transcript_6499/g.20474 Transcript_6499/m.20474 type:complete len:498 (-) Transcript_6499:64-1557(-)